MNENGHNRADNDLFEALGFKCGIEIHQQLNTKTKLFCHCPTGLTNDRHDAEILRHMRPTLSELGEYDGTALMEFKTKKEVIYRLYRDRTCTYEMDDTPPFLVNQVAIDYAIRLALLFNCKIINELHVIRKQYLDGSIPTGFQRTMIIGIDGYIPYKDRQIKISQVNLEEESCREVSDIGHRIVFATDRLSIPLVEIITGADMKTPQEAAEVCRLLGNAMKITGLVRRGIGTVRQDVNVSVTGGDRVEIKGVHKVGNIPVLTQSEAGRQKGLLELKKIFIERYKRAENINWDELNITSLFSGSTDEIGRRLESDTPLKVTALLLPGMVDIISYKLQPNRDFGFELSGRVRVIACIDSKPNLFFYSQREKYDIPEEQWEKIIDKMNPGRSDDIVLVCGPTADVITAIDEIKIRIGELAIGVIQETRQDIKDGTTDFERILPGPDRMYPDTDHPPVRIDIERVKTNRGTLSEPLWEKHKRWRELGLHDEQVKALSLSLYADLFDRLAQNKTLNPKKAAFICSALMVGLRREGYDLSESDQNSLYDIITESLTHHWSFGRLKATLITLSTGETIQVTNVTFDENIFEQIWNQSRLSFNGNNSSNALEKFRRFTAGQILRQYHDTSLVLSKIDTKLKLEKKLRSK